MFNFSSATPPTPQANRTVPIATLWSQLTNAAEQLVRLTCQQQGMTPAQTDIITAICWAESGMNPQATHHNENGTTDYGICQFNDYWYIGIGKVFASPQEVLDNPQACIVEMCKLVKTSALGFNLWVTFKTGAYKQYLGK